MSEPRSITGIQEIRDAVRAEQERARRAGSPAVPSSMSRMGRASLPQRIMSMVRGLPLLGRAARWAYGLYRAPGRIRDLLTLIRLGDDEAKRARAEREELGASLKQAQAEREELGASLKQAQAEREELGTSLKRARAEREELGLSLKRAQAEREELGASLKRDMAAQRRLLEDELQRLRRTSTEVEAGLAGLSRLLQDQRAGVDDLKGRLAIVTGRAADLGRSLAAAETRLGALQTEVAGMREPLAGVRAEQEGERRREEAVAAVYPRLESHFRGPRALIRERQSIYLPYLLEEGPAKNGLPVLDLGCGRGEWLELLAENGFAVRGVEQNQELAEECRGRGLSVEEGEAGLFLSHLKPASVGAVTAFHLLEHLSFAAWLGLLQETVRVLAPGGMAIFETPNPENILVSSGDFFLDPTHERPIPSRLLCYVAKTVGLVRSRVLELHPRGDGSQEPGGGTEPLLERHLLGPQDYAVVAWKD